jgi:hypothetical protein
MMSQMRIIRRAGSHDRPDVISGVIREQVDHVSLRVAREAGDGDGMPALVSTLVASTERSRPHTSPAFCQRSPIRSKKCWKRSMPDAGQAGVVGQFLIARVA